MLYKTSYSSPLGDLTLVGDGQSLMGLWMEGQKYFGGALSGEIELLPRPELFKPETVWLDRYFSGDRPDIATLELAPEGSSFRRLIWKLLCGIPYGQVVSYGELAAAAADKLALPQMSARAVGAAVGHNPISIIIPCHRVIGADGSLTGYAGGLERKRMLLEHEGAKLSRLA